MRWDVVPPATSSAISSPGAAAGFGSAVPAQTWLGSRAALLFISPELHKVGTGVWGWFFFFPGLFQISEMGKASSLFDILYAGFLFAR